MRAQSAIKIMLYAVGVLTLFHISILLKIIPYDITWGGRLNNDAEMYAFESFSLAVNLFLGFILLIRGQHIKALIPAKVVKVILWLFLVLFALNTIGNLVAETTFEKFFAALTFLFCFLIGVILRGKE